MNGDIRVHTTFLRHPKTRKLRRRLGADGVLSLLALWIFAAESRPSGCLSGLEAEDVAEVAGWTDEPSKFVDALSQIGFLEHDGDQYAIHDWVENNPWAAGAETRSAKARKAAKVRWDKKAECSEHCSEHDQALPQAESGNAPFLSSPSPKEDTSKPSAPTCPHEAIIDHYHKLLPELPRVLKARWKGSLRERDLQTRWKEDEQHRDLNFWRWFFESVKKNPFWLGENERGWRADLGWLLKRKNFDNVVEKSLDQRRRSA